MGDEAAMIDDEEDAPEILISISQLIALDIRVAAGEFASMDEAIAKSSEELQLTKVGEDWYSAETLDRLREGMRQSDAGELVPQERVEAFFAEWERETSERPCDYEDAQ
jgi:predicted transcriptional regulator